MGEHKGGDTGEATNSHKTKVFLEIGVPEKKAKSLKDISEGVYF